MKEWYLIGSNTKPNMLGGYENQAFCDFKNDAFFESLDTDIASTVRLYNYDLTKWQDVRCIIQDNVASTYLKSIERTILFPIGTAKAGMYVFFEDRYWLITGYPGNNKIYEKVTAILCQYQLRWQNSRGDIIERWTNITSASKYDVGENGNNIIMLTSNNYTILIPNDEESMNLDEKRVFIDKNKKNPKKVFKITRNDDSLYDYGTHGGLLSLIADKTELNLDTDNLELMICDYIAPLTDSSSVESIPPQSPVLLTPVISYRGKPELKVGGNRKSVIGYFVDEDETRIDDTGHWEVICVDELIPHISYIINDNTLMIKISDDDFAIGGKVRLKFSNALNTISTYVDFNITSVF